MSIIYATEAKIIIDEKEYEIDNFSFKFDDDKWYKIFVNLYWKIKIIFLKKKLKSTITIN